jgi:hypothetical protein
MVNVVVFSSRPGGVQGLMEMLTRETLHHDHLGANAG